MGRDGAKNKTIKIGSVERKEIAHFLATNIAKLPPAVRSVLEHALSEGVDDDSIVVSLRREMKAIPSSEKKTDAGSENRRRRRSPEEKIKYHEEIIMKHQKKKRDLKKKQKQIDAKKRREREAADLRTEARNTANRHVKTTDEQRRNLCDDPNDLEGTEFEDDEDSPAPTVDEMREILNSGAETNQNEFDHSSIRMFASALETGSADDKEMEIVQVNSALREHATLGGFSRSIQPQKRFDFELTAREKNFGVEVLTNSRTGERTYASTQVIGPANTQLTWRTVVNIILAVVAFVIPIRRLERLLGGLIGNSTMVKILADAAAKGLPIYFHIAECLANARYLSTDDTPTRVNEVTRWKKQVAKWQADVKEWEDNSRDDKRSGLQIGTKPAIPTKPWEARIEKAKLKWQGLQSERREQGLADDDRELTLLEKTREKLGFEFPLRRKNDATKISFMTTVVHGRTDSSEPHSKMIFYRSHFGNAGDLLSEILKDRNPKNKELTIQGDLSSANDVADPTVKAKFSIEKAGCMSHARRPFFRYRHHDPELADAMLDGFTLIAHVESMLHDSEVGQNDINTRAAREQIAMVHWNDNLEIAKTCLSRWSDLTPLGKGIRYFIKHFEHLTTYIRHPKLDPTNNGSESLLRIEGLEDASSFGRDTVDGRIRIDILRSLAATAAAAHVDVRLYFIFLLIASHDDLVVNPHFYLPHMLAKWTAPPPENLLSAPNGESIARQTAIAAQQLYQLHFA